MTVALKPMPTPSTELRLGTPAPVPNTVQPASPWLTVKDAALRARCGIKTIYREVAAGRLRAAKIGGRRELRLKPEWVDDWLLRASEPEAA
jgi:excisionase family DNA binding protein